MFASTIGASFSRSETSGRIGMHSWPRPCVIMKLTISGVTFSAAQMKSPSFSRSSASTTMTTSPRPIASIAASMVEKFLLTVELTPRACCRRRHDSRRMIDYDIRCRVIIGREDRRNHRVINVWSDPLTRFQASTASGGHRIRAHARSRRIHRTGPFLRDAGRAQRAGRLDAGPAGQRARRDALDDQAADGDRLSGRRAEARRRVFTRPWPSCRTTSRPFRRSSIGEAESDTGRFDLLLALRILAREAAIGPSGATPQGIFLYEFESLARNRLGYDRGLEAIAGDPMFDELGAMDRAGATPGRPGRLCRSDLRAQRTLRSPAGALEARPERRRPADGARGPVWRGRGADRAGQSRQGSALSVQRPAPPSWAIPRCRGRPRSTSRRSSCRSWCGASNGSKRG